MDSTKNRNNTIRIVAATFVGQTPTVRTPILFNAVRNNPPIRKSLSRPKGLCLANESEKLMAELNISGDTTQASKKSNITLKATITTTKFNQKIPTTARANPCPNSPLHKAIKNLPLGNKENCLPPQRCKSNFRGLKPNNYTFRADALKIRNVISPLNRTKQVNVSATNNAVVDKASNYILGKQIGQGAYATVKEGMNKVNGNKVAIKIYEKYRLLDPQRKKCATREIDILRKVSHQNIVKFYETVDTAKQLYLVFELIKGKSLCSYIRAKESKKLDEKEARSIFTQLVAGIEYCHSMGILHRDIKLDNILIDQAHKVKVIDFGFATYIEPNTRLRSFCGTPSYMAPEIVLKKPYDGKTADIWALGVVLYALLTGKFPFKGVTEKDLYRKIAKGEFVIPACVPQQAKVLIEKILSLDPAKRPSCADILRDPFLLGSKDGVACRPYVTTSGNSHEKIE